MKRWSRQSSAIVGPSLRAHVRFSSRRAALEAPVLTTKLSAVSAAWGVNAAAMQTHLDELRARLARAHAGGGPTVAARHKARGKLLARERIEALVDPGTPFLELSPLAGDELYVSVNQGQPTNYLQHAVTL